MIEFHALGAVTATDDGAEVNLGGPRQRRLLAMLLIHRGTVVSADRLADAIFAGEPTPGAATTLRSYVARLRKALGDGPRVLTQAPGYLLDLGPAGFDVVRFEAALAESGRRLARADAVGALESAREALGCWRGDAYAEFADEDWARPEAQRLAELRAVAQERTVEAMLAAGRAPEAIPLVEAVLVEHPYRESFRGHHAVALYRSGRQTDALRSLQEFRRLLGEELGLDPSPELADLERRVLEHDPELAASEVAGSPLRGYRLGERLGTGRDGTVHAARLPGAERDLAIRVIRRDIADDPTFVRTFDATAHRASSLRHPAIVPIHDHWREPGAAYVVMRRMHGGSLAERLEQRAPSPAEVAAIVERVGGALLAAADAGVAHGRVSPSAVLYDGAGEPFLSDFAIGTEPGSGPGDHVAFAALVSACLGRARSDLDALLADPPPLAELVPALVRALADAPPTAEPARANPYKGLHAFEEADAGHFFGRDAMLDELATRLSGDDLRSRIVLVVGGSGTGKSSVVRAGLLPRLRAGAAPGSSRWFTTTMVPGADPWQALAAGLREVAVADDPDLAHHLAAGPEGIDRVVRRLLPDGGQLLLVVDQFEELFTLADDGVQRAFAAGLVHAITVPDSRLRLVATLRADYYDRPLALQGLGPLVAPATVAVAAMSPAELEAAIVEPIELVGGSVDRALLVELVSAVVDEPAALPSLQFTLYELAERAPTKELTLAAYHQLGGVSGAIASRAEAFHDGLGGAERAALRRLFGRLVVLEDDGEPARRRVPRSELAALPDGSAVEAAIDRLAAARLLSLDRDPGTRMPTVEVAHEALLREWPRLRSWIDEDRQAITVLGQLRESAATWIGLDRDPGALLRGARLEVALDLAEERGEALPEAEQELLDASRAARDAEQRIAEEHVARQARANRRLRIQLGAIGAALVVALMGGVTALDQRSDAERERRVATARELAAASAANVDADPELSTLLALAAVDESRDAGGGVLPEAETALHRAVTSSRVLWRVDGTGGAVDWTPDGSTFVTEGAEESGLIELRDAATGETVRSWPGHEPDINDVAFGADGALLASTGDDSALRVWEVATGDLLFEVLEPELGADAWAPAFSPDGSLVVAGWLDSQIAIVYDVATGDEVSRIFGPYPSSASFSPDGDRLAIADNAGALPVVVDARTGALVYVLQTEGGYVRHVAWSPDGRWIAGSGGDGTVRLFDADTGEIAFTGPGHEGEGEEVDWSGDASRLASGAGDGTVRIWDLDGYGLHPAHVLSSDSTRGGLGGVAISADGDRVLAGDAGVSSVTMWDIAATGGGELAAVEVGWSWESASFTPDGDAIRVRAPGGIGRFDARTGLPAAEVIPFADEGDAVRTVPSPDGQLLAVHGDGGPGEVLDADTGELLWSFGDPFGTVYDIGWAGDGDHLAASVVSPTDQVDERRVVVLDRSGVELAALPMNPDWWATSVSMSGDGRLVAIAPRGWDRNIPEGMDIQVWDWAADEIVNTLDSEIPLDRVEFAASGDQLVAGGWLQGAVELWDAGTGERLATLAAPPIVSAMALSPDGQWAATGHRDGTVRVWGTTTGVQRVVLEGHDRVVNAVAFSPDGTRLLSVGDDGIARVWALDIDELVAEAQQRLTRGFTDAECRQYLHLDRCET